MKQEDLEKGNSLSKRIDDVKKQINAWNHVLSEDCSSRELWVKIYSDGKDPYIPKNQMNQVAFICLESYKKELNELEKEFNEL